MISTYIVPVEGASDDEEDCDVEITFTPRHIEHVWQCHLQAMSCHCHQTKIKIIYYVTIAIPYQVSDTFSQFNSFFLESEKNKKH